MSLRVFGRAAGADVLEATVASGDGLEARVLTWGAVLCDLRVPDRDGRPRSVVLGFDALEPYLQEPGHLGAVIGRYANRIAGGRFLLGGREVRLVPNEGPNTLHGGSAGFGRRAWSLVGHDETSVHLALVSADGDMGFPGRLVAVASYDAIAPATLRISLQAFADAPTPVNLTTHSYYNLDGSPDVRGHRLRVHADAFTPVDGASLPTGEIAPVAGTPFDLRGGRPLGEGAPSPGFDVNLALAQRPGQPSLAHAATLRSELSGIRMELWTTEPGLQLYDGHKLALSAPGRGGARYGPFAGVALEPQRFPDGPNQAGFPPSLLVPGLVSRQVSELRFSRDG